MQSLTSTLPSFKSFYINGNNCFMASRAGLGNYPFY